VKVIQTISEFRAIRWQNTAATWGLVPTMGFLHEGHLSLVRQAKAENEKIVVSIFVNPTQFAPTEDLSSYPRDLERDLALLQNEGVDLVFTPSNEEIYPSDFQTEITVRQVSKPLEGSSRPTHFQGVATVVAKLFNIVQPTRAYFGQKDAQQTVVLKQMVRDLNFNLEMKIGPTVREADGLAMSSRNKNLSPEHRQAANVLYRALHAAKEAGTAGEIDGYEMRHIMEAVITAEPLARLDYVSAANPLTLEEVGVVAGEVLLSTAVLFGKTRLIDNVLLTIDGSKTQTRHSQ
jgi:pantoate--beta-alanine ligase